MTDIESTTAEYNAQEAYLDPETGVVVVSDLPPEELVESAELVQLLPRKVQRALASWAEDIHTPARRSSNSLFQRDRYMTPGKVMEQMAVAYETLDDDVVGNVADMSEGLAFQKISFEGEDADQEDVWNQIGRDLDLDGWIRQAWRELFTVSQFYGVRWWGFKNYKVRGKADKRKKRKEFNLDVPIALGFLDPTRVVPVKPDIFGNTQLAWIASEPEMGLFESQAVEDDALIRALWSSTYKPDKKETHDLTEEGIPTERLILLNPQYVFRHTLTKAPYERWARVRMKSIFSLLDLKEQLQKMDRAFLLGGINFLVLVTRGSDQIPAKREEVTQTASMVRTQSRSPIIVSDHRISVEIITPDLKEILSSDKWGVLDERLMMRLWGTFQLPSQTGGRETSMTLSRIIARGMESRRHMLKRCLEKYLIREVLESQFNIKAGFDAEVSLEFAPRRMELEMDPALINVLQELRDRGDLSRETVLQELNFDQGLEARRREIEKKEFDKIFTPTNVPFDSPARTQGQPGATPGGAGRQGGRPAGSSSGSGSATNGS